eukprot:TRINITY_DN15675_c0_g1_i1.p1 TRINITY_DN15675_c0_g1~~TRINITY_DN15675_c0_g1_i1.p1  ORF type:complete len:198 (-),score=22.64 TRINITY_DN15675_c0_g1_i1:159-752(-)
MVFTETPAEAPANNLSPPSFLSTLRYTVERRYQALLDSSTAYVLYRWIGTAILTIIYLYRVFTLNGWYVVSYALAIYVLNLLIGFLSPKVDPEVESNVLPTKANDEFRPFIRRLPEFKFWYATTRALIIGIFCTLFAVFNIPVFWPILLIYFIALFGFTMKKQIKHMITHKYVPMTVGKPKHNDKAAPGAATPSKAK